MLLYFLRHGLAGTSAEWSGPDAERPLTDEGVDRMRREAEAIARLGLRLDAVVSSPLTRALQTAEIVADRLGMLDRLVVDQRVGPGFSLSQLKRVVSHYGGEAASLMVVGHEPSFSETVSDLIGGGSIVMKKGGLACVDAVDVSPGAGHLVWLLPPKILAP